MTFDAYLKTRAICLTLDAETIDDQVIRYMREAWEAGVVASVAAMTDEQRMELFANYCTHCGCPDPRCQCWNDE